MKSRPILFSAPMVRALLDGTKTQTRRIMKGQPFISSPEFDSDDGVAEFHHADECVSRISCPYGKIGDELWVRETWSKAKRSLLENELFYRADGEHQSGRQRSLNYVERESKWRPSIHMPRKYSRITLEITGVKVERLQDISEEDAITEGIQQYKGPLRWIRYMDAVTGEAAHNSARDAFASLWESINGAGSWDQNPWLWCISFRRLTP